MATLFVLPESYSERAEDGPGREEGGKKDARLLWQQPATVCAAAAGIGGAATNARKESPRCTDGGSGLLGVGLRGLAKKKIGRTRRKR